MTINSVTRFHFFFLGLLPFGVNANGLLEVSTLLDFSD